MAASADAVPLRVLATDLDGTLIPLDGNLQNVRDLAVLRDRVGDEELDLVYVTGRHLASVRAAIDAHGLPYPDWIICDVGTSIYERDSADGIQPVQAYADHLQAIIRDYPIPRLREELLALGNLTAQEDEKQGPFKLSFYAEASRLSALTETLEATLQASAAPYSMIVSVDPFNGDGLIDLLPARASKAHALDWWAARRSLDQQQILFSGDSGNDLAALTAGYRSIVVGNADRSLAQRVEQVHQRKAWTGRLFLARHEATSGVLEGLDHYLGSRTF